MFDAYVEAKNRGSANPGSDAQHDAMAENYINNIARGLQEFDVINHNNPEITFEHYRALAWVGLQETKAYRNLSPEAEDQIDRQRDFIRSWASLLNCK